jgi:hypothetical protein
MRVLWKIAVVLGLGSVMLAQAPTSGSESSAKKNAGASQEVTAAPADNFYKLSFAIYELDDGKRMNQRDYSIIGKTNSAPPISARVWTRLPMYSEEKKVTYVNGGLEIRCSLKDVTAGRVQASCDFEITSFVLPEQAVDARSNVPGVPILRTTSTSTWAVLTPGKPAIISSIDDVNSKKRTQIEVTATRLD